MGTSARRDDRRGETQTTRPRERELIARWGAGAWLGWTLRTSDGASYTLLFQGRPGGPAGPDFRDAVLADSDGARLTGDIELHLIPAGWRAHGHSGDPRYNDLALHVTLADGRGNIADVSVLASGRAPLVVLATQQAPTTTSQPAWPCAGLIARTTPPARLALLRAAGWARFDERVAAFEAALAEAPSAGVVGVVGVVGVIGVAGWSAADSALCVALAEGLGYGRDRAALRLCGERLARGEPPDALLTTALRLPVIERRRLDGLLCLLERWSDQGPLALLSDARAVGQARRGERRGR